MLLGEDTENIIVLCGNRIGEALKGVVKVAAVDMTTDLNNSE